MTPEQYTKIDLAVNILKRVSSVMRPVEEDGEIIYQDNGDFLLQMNELDFNRLQQVIDDLKYKLEYNG